MFLRKLHHFFTSLLYSGQLLDSEALTTKKVQLINFISFFALPLFLLFTFVNSAFEYHVINGVIFVLFIYLFWKLRQGVGHIDHVSNVLLLGMYLSHVGALFQGGILNSGFLWMFFFPLFSIFLKNSTTGLRWVGLLLGSIVVVYVLIALGVVEVPYDKNYLIFMLLVLSIETLYVHFSNGVQVLFEGKLHATNEKLKQFNHQLSSKVAQEVARNREKDSLLSQQSKMAAMGEMMANITHQWKQPLGTIGIIVQNIQLSDTLGTLDMSEVSESMQEINNQITLMNQTIRDFTQFVKPSREKRVFELQKAVDDALHLISATLYAKNIAVQRDYLEQSPLVFGHENELKHVIINIINNAKEAFAEKAVEKPVLTLHILQHPNAHELRIQDNAQGIPAHVIDRIFEPFFTTKSDGTGLGLYMSQKIIQESFGSMITIRNTHEGAQFSILFPLCTTQELS